MKRKNSFDVSNPAGSDRIEIGAGLQSLVPPRYASRSGPIYTVYLMWNWLSNLESSGPDGETLTLGHHGLLSVLERRGRNSRWLSILLKFEGKQTYVCMYVLLSSHEPPNGEARGKYQKMGNNSRNPFRPFKYRNFN
ncbi:hypothetical protein AVEN_178967-1 [Araneus ventricosus]|uniref:Uncharacterized protein n=1 Tax=Araneus ventricosus TaxID=182803 RepID=A0A4Y2Q0N4_ARAVE|nr:hypothetical protein AVEN_178967-1 [Araneus ventricosus]